MMSFVFCWYRLPVKYNLNRITPIIIFISFVYFYFSKSVQMKKVFYKHWFFTFFSSVDILKALFVSRITGCSKISKACVFMDELYRLSYNTGPRILQMNLKLATAPVRWRREIEFTRFLSKKLVFHLDWKLAKYDLLRKTFVCVCPTFVLNVLRQNWFSKLVLWKEMGPNNAIRATVREETFLTTSLDVKLQSFISQIVR